MDKKMFLAMSLPFELKCRCEYSNDDYTIEELIGVSRNCEQIECDDFDGNIDEVTPILHPLSDLTKDEWIEKLNTFACKLLDAAHVYDEKNIIGLNWMKQPFEIVMWLVKNHFNLMDESEPFIDVNTLEINLYK